MYVKYKQFGCQPVTFNSRAVGSREDCGLVKFCVVCLPGVQCDCDVRRASGGSV
jgi:hypothetical protein